jgi:tRNA-splicing ligase RtcB
MNYSYANRQVITQLAREGFKKIFPNVEIKTFWCLSHNSARFEYHKVNEETKKLLVHRKGATRAFGPGRKELPDKFREIGQPVIIGGTMGTYSYILSGTEYGMRSAFGSACHGAGRAMSRTQAKKRWQGKELARKGICVMGHSWRGLAEEAPGAYKDVEKVIDAVHTADLAKKVVRLRPMGCIKG